MVSLSKDVLMVDPVKDARIAHPNQPTIANTNAQAMHAIQSQLQRMNIGQQAGQQGGSVQQGYPQGVAGHPLAASMPHPQSGAPSLGGGAMPINVGHGYQHGRTQSIADQQMRHMSNAGMQQQHPGRQQSLPMPEVGIPDIQQLGGQNYAGQQQYMTQPVYPTIVDESQNLRRLSMSPQMRAANVQVDPFGYPVYNAHSLQSRDIAPGHNMHSMVPQPIGTPRNHRRSTVAGPIRPQVYLEEDFDSDSDVDEFQPRPIIPHRSSFPNTHPPPMVEFPMGARSMVGNPAMTVGAPMAGPISNYPPQPQFVQRDAAGNMVIAADRFERPYRVSSGYIPGRSPAYPTLSQDIVALRTFFQATSGKFKDLPPPISMLVRKSAYEIDALRHGYRAFCGGQDPGVLMGNCLAGADLHIAFAFMGLILGPANFDLWLSTHHNVRCLHI
jgi:hypothetical protein